MNDVILHVGFGKTGTSSLQKFLSFNPVLSGAEQTYEYISLQVDGRVLSGDALEAAAHQSPHGYSVSTPRIDLVENFGEICDHLQSCWDAEVIPVLSQEDWGRQGDMFKEHKVLSNLGGSVHVVFYVRPQVSWFNSGWWQWFAWNDDFQCPEDVINNWGVGFLNWFQQITVWTSIPEVSKVTVRLQCKDVIDDFCTHILGLKPEVDTNDFRSNDSLSSLLAKTYLAYPGFRTHLSSEVENILNPYFTSGGKAPWVVDPVLAEFIVSSLKNDNERLSDFLSNEQRLRFHSDASWWSVEAFDEKFNESVHDFCLTDGEKDQVIEGLLKLVHNKLV